MEVMTAWMVATSSAVADAATGVRLHDEVWSVGSSILLAALVGALALSLGKKSKAASFGSDAASNNVTDQSAFDDLIDEDFVTMGMPAEPHLEGGFQPPTRLIHSNSHDAFAFDNEMNCSGLFLVLHRPTYDSQLNNSSSYLYGDYFEGKKRLWELRFRVQFKRRVPQSDLFFGVELEEYVPVNAATKRVMDLSVAGMRQVVGDRLYHTLGDQDPVESERPAIMMPLWAFDQFIETPEGETPPDLSDPNLPEYGHKRVGQIREYKRLMDSLDLRPGPTFTFCFWGVSRFCDVIGWQATGIPIFTPLDLNLYCGKPPLHLVLYTLQGGQAPFAVQEDLLLSLRLLELIEAPEQGSGPKIRRTLAGVAEASQAHPNWATRCCHRAFYLRSQRFPVLHGSRERAFSVSHLELKWSENSPDARWSC
ncbi:unnamed protein product [Effrenium voratum]|nr:unnamed protein product [Effrenium voratum]